MQELEQNPAGFLVACDVAAFVFDGSNLESFRAAHELLLKLAHLSDDSIPCVFIAAKDDLGISMVSIFPHMSSLMTTAHAIYNLTKTAVCCCSSWQVFVSAPDIKHEYLIAA